jgi:hypothetical protein
MFGRLVEVSLSEQKMSEPRLDEMAFRIRALTYLQQPICVEESKPAIPRKLLRYTCIQLIIRSLRGRGQELSRGCRATQREQRVSRILCAR